MKALKRNWRTPAVIAAAIAASIAVGATTVSIMGTRTTGKSIDARPAALGFLGTAGKLLGFAPSAASAAEEGGDGDPGPGDQDPQDRMHPDNQAQQFYNIIEKAEATVGAACGSAVFGIAGWTAAIVTGGACTAAVINAKADISNAWLNLPNRDSRVQSLRYIAASGQMGTFLGLFGEMVDEKGLTGDAQDLNFAYLHCEREDASGNPNKSSSCAEVIGDNTPAGSRLRKILADSLAFAKCMQSSDYSDNAVLGCRGVKANTTVTVNQRDLPPRDRPDPNAINRIPGLGNLSSLGNLNGGRSLFDALLANVRVVQDSEVWANGAQIAPGKWTVVNLGNGRTAQINVWVYGANNDQIGGYKVIANGVTYQVNYIPDQSGAQTGWIDFQGGGVKITARPVFVADPRADGQFKLDHWEFKETHQQTSYGWFDVNKSGQISVHFTNGDSLVVLPNGMTYYNNVPYSPEELKAAIAGAPWYTADQGGVNGIKDAAALDVMARNAWCMGNVQCNALDQMFDAFERFLAFGGGEKDKNGGDICVYDPERCGEEG